MPDHTPVAAEFPAAAPGDAAGHSLSSVARAGQEPLRAVLDNAPQGVLVRTADGEMLYVNRALAAIHGFESLAEFGKALNYTRYIHPDDRPLVTARAYARVSNQEAPPVYEFRFLRRDGSVGWMEVNATHAAWDGQPVSLSWLTDITQRKRAEEALRRSEQLFIKVFQASPDVITLSTVAEGRYIEVNESFLKVSRRERSEIIGRTSLDLGIWSDPDLRPRLVDRLQRDGYVKEVVSLIFAADGEPRDYSVSGEIFRFEEQDLLLMICHDVTEQRRKEAARWRSQKLEALGTLAGGIAHDLNNALVPVMTLAKVTAHRLPEGGRERNNLTIIAGAGERARDLVKQILAFSREERANKTEVDLAAVLREGMHILRAGIATTIAITLDIRAEAWVLADVGQLHQVVVNLVTNAAQAIGSAIGTIGIALYRGERPGDSGPQETVCLAVTDTGCGMDEATMSRIFEPFFTTKKVGEGTGLGLSVVHGIVTHHGGHIEVRSAPGRGTTFTVHLPIVASDHADATGRAA
jgi:two-component system, cell cycle sensor histidine kinase and response regulator CckA